MDPNATGKLHHKQFFEMMRKMPPPLGFGQNCPLKRAFSKMIMLNLPVDENQLTVDFQTALFAVVRKNLSIKTPAGLSNWKLTDDLAKMKEMNVKFARGSMRADEELPQILLQNWPQSSKILDLLVPQEESVGRGSMTTGKLYTGLILLENWKLYKRAKH